MSCDKDTLTCAAKGKAANIQKIVDMRGGCGSVAMALASGITPANAAEYAPLVDCFMVATGISPPGEQTSLFPSLLLTLSAHALTCTHPEEGLVTFKRILGCVESACSENGYANQIADLQFVM